MRNFLLLIFSVINSQLFSQTLDFQSSLALKHIKNGEISLGVEELQKAAAQNSLAAQYYIAKCYEKNIGIKQDQAKAFYYYRRAAERGLPDAMTDLAFCYKNGIGVLANYQRYEEWMQRFLRKGGKYTLPNIVDFYIEGQNTNREIKSPTYIPANDKQRTPSSDKTKLLVENKKAKVPSETVFYQNERQQSYASPKSHQSDVDLFIPRNTNINKDIFALIITNEKYKNETTVPYANNDGNIFEEYCKKTLAIPNTNIHILTNATLNDIRHEVKWLQDVINVYNGDAHVIFYYAGHGIPDEKNKSAYLLPVDGYGSDVTTGYSLDDLYKALGNLPSKSVTVFLDACFSGANRDGGMLASARGVAIKVKSRSPIGNMVVFTAAQGDETAYPYKEEGHGLFTYYLLKKLQETKGNVTLGELGDYIQTQVRRQSVVVNGKLQSPSILVSPNIGNNWKSWKLK